MYRTWGVTLIRQFKRYELSEDKTDKTLDLLLNIVTGFVLLEVNQVFVFMDLLEVYQFENSKNASAQD